MEVDGVGLLKSINVDARTCDSSEGETSLDKIDGVLAGTSPLTAASSELTVANSYSTLLIRVHIRVFHTAPHQQIFIAIRYRIRMIHLNWRKIIIIENLFIESPYAGFPTCISDIPCIEWLQIMYLCDFWDIVNIERFSG